MLCTAALILIFIVFIQVGGREKVIEVFGGNVGFDSMSRAVEVAISRNPAAAMVFNMKDDGVHVFAHNGDAGRNS